MHSLSLEHSYKPDKGTGQVTMCEKLSMGMDKSMPPPLPDVEIYTVDFDGMSDPMHPYNWKRSTKYVSFY